MQQQQGESPKKADTTRRGVLAPRPHLWEALERGPLLRKVLESFYEKIYKDERLSPFFVHTTIEWAIDHQYAFMAQIFSGQDMFFGDRPRNAHHWMIISNELFDYRQEIMMQTLAEHGISKQHAEEWREVENAFRKHIVKDKPWPKKRNGVALPLEGLETVELTVGAMCDTCQRELPEGTSAEYHVRTGEMYCTECVKPVRAKLGGELDEEALAAATAAEKEDEEAGR